MKYNIVFLDFDGVLNGSEWFSEITVKDEQTGIYKRTTESSISEYFSKEWIEKNNDYKIKITSFGRNISKYNMNNLINALSQIDERLEGILKDYFKFTITHNVVQCKYCDEYMVKLKEKESICPDCLKRKNQMIIDMKIREDILKEEK